MSLTRKQRLLATLRGEPVDRPAVNFYETGGFLVDPHDQDEYNIYNSPSWQPLLQLAEESTDLIRMMSPVRKNSHLAWDPAISDLSMHNQIRQEIWETPESRFTRISYGAGSRTLSSLTRRDKNLDTVWTQEPLLKTKEDVLRYLDLPESLFEEQIDITPLVAEERRLGERGLVMVDTEDPICAVAGLFTMEDFSLFAFTEKELCHQLLQKQARIIHKRTAQVAKEFPGRLWRIYGPEYITPPFFPPSLFPEYVLPYDVPMIDLIHEFGGFARIHCHGNIREVLPAIVEMGADAIDPIEPPSQGNMELSEVRKKYGEKLVLFGNIEVADIENCPSDRFRKIVKKSIQEGTDGAGRGFVLMPSASPYGREISPLCLDNYKIMIELANIATTY